MLPSAALCILSFVGKNMWGEEGIKEQRFYSCVDASICGSRAKARFWLVGLDGLFTRLL